MKTPFFKTTFLAFSLLSILASCNKTVETLPQYLRSGNSLVVANSGTGTGNLVIAGYSNKSANGYDAILVMANPLNGDTMWTKTFGNSYSDAFYSVKNANIKGVNKGGFIVTGFSNRANASSPTMLVVITDANGKTVTTKTYGGTTAYSQGFNVLPVADSGYLVSGLIQKSSASDRDIYLVRIRETGDTIWARSFGAKGIDPYDSINDAAYAAVEAPGGGFFITGSIHGYTQNGGKIFLMKVSSTGKELWTKIYNYGIGFSITLTRDNGIAISGSLQEGGRQDIFLLKTDTAGIVQWGGIKTFGGGGYNYGASMIETSDGGFAITGITDGQGNGNQDVYLIRTNSTGDKIWDKTYGGSDNDQGFGLIQMPDDGGFCITGLSNSGGSYIFLNRTSSDGTQGWVKYIQ